MLELRTKSNYFNSLIGNFLTLEELGPHQFINMVWLHALLFLLLFLLRIQFVAFTCSCPVFPAPLIEEAVFSPLYILASFIKNKVIIGAWVFLWAFYPVPLIYISVFVPVPYCLVYCSFVVQSEVREPDSSSSVFLSQDCFCYSRSFVFPYKLWNSVICSEVDGPRICHTEWSKSEREKQILYARSEERRVGKECRSRWSPYH